MDLTVAVLQMQPESAAPQVAQHAPAAAPTAAPVVEAAPDSSLAQAEPESGMPDLPAAETAWEASYQTEALLAVDDTTQFTDSEIGFLLY